jgi:phosphatidylserine/phosphatidylglycerophosphate/cardiolipin synthase-like enzyme
LTKALIAAAAQGASVRLMVHDTGRRVPDDVISQLRAAGIDVHRFIHPEALPMHAKFLLVDDAAWFGSFNFNPRSRWLNREILLSSRHPAVLAALEERFEQIAAAPESGGEVRR